MLKKNKKGNAQSDWVSAYRQAWLEKDTARAALLIEKAVSRIPADTDKCIYGWSGGKDALVLQEICEQAGVKKCVLGTIGEQWEYPAFWEFVQRNLPPGCEIRDAKITDDFFEKNESLAFPQTSKDAYRWYRLCNQRAYYEFAVKNGAEHIILGHRTADGNVCADSGRGKVFPIYDFSHEDIFCILACTGRRLPETYFYKDGFYHGTHAWIMRSGPDAIEDIYRIDPGLLKRHKGIEKIRRFLNEHGY